MTKKLGVLLIFGLFMSAPKDLYSQHLGTQDHLNAHFSAFKQSWAHGLAAFITIYPAVAISSELLPSCFKTLRNLNNQENQALNKTSDTFGRFIIKAKFNIKKTNSILGVLVKLITAGSACFVPAHLGKTAIKHHHRTYKEKIAATALAKKHHTKSDQ